MIARPQKSKLSCHYNICIASTEFRSSPLNPDVILKVSSMKKDLSQEHNHLNMEEKLAKKTLYHIPE